MNSRQIVLKFLNAPLNVQLDMMTKAGVKRDGDAALPRIDLFKRFVERAGAKLTVKTITDYKP